MIVIIMMIRIGMRMMMMMMLIMVIMMITNISRRRGGRGRPCIAHHSDSWTIIPKIQKKKLFCLFSTKSWMCKAHIWKCPKCKRGVVKIFNCFSFHCLAKKKIVLLLRMTVESRVPIDRAYCVQAVSLSDRHWHIFFINNIMCYPTAEPAILHAVYLWPHTLKL